MKPIVVKMHISKPMGSEFKIMKRILTSASTYNFDTSIAYIVEREPDFVTHGDVSLEAGEGLCGNS